MQLLWETEEVELHIENPIFQVVRAIKPIKAGEEIFVSYIDPLPKKNFDTTATRRARLQRQYRFTCKCEACEKGLNDRKRKKISIIENLQDPNYIEEEFRLAKEIGLHSGILWILAAKCMITKKLTGEISVVKMFCREAKFHIHIAFGTEFEMMFHCLNRIESAVDFEGATSFSKYIQLQYLIYGFL